VSGAARGLISVVIPAYNAGKYIVRTIESVRNQSHRELEIVIADDGSTDDTIALVETVAAQDARITLLKLPHRGVSHARNRAIKHARGNYIAPIDADDLWHRDKLRRQFEILNNARRETGVVYCWAAGIDEDDNIVLPVWSASYAAGDVLEQIVERGILSCGSTPLIRKECVTKAGGYDETLHLAEDWKFYTALAGLCRFEVIPECLTGYRIRTDSTSLNLKPMERALQECTAWIRTKWPALPEQVLIEREFMLNIYLAFMAIREAQYVMAMRYLVRAAKAKPSRLFGLQIWELALLIPAHAAGLRRYEWALWRSPRKFAQ
jgi:glycosyltransferase involved in cell wall biosynthesis